MRLGHSLEVAFSPDGELLAVARETGVAVYRVSAGKAKKLETFRAPGLAHVAFSRDGHLLMKAEGGFIRVVSPLDPMDVRLPLPGFGVLGAAPRFQAHGALLVDSSYWGQVGVIDTETGAFVWEKHFKGELITQVLSTADGGTWMFGHVPRAKLTKLVPGPDWFSVWSHPFGEEPIGRVEPKLADMRTAALSPDGSRLAIVHGTPPSAIAIVDTGTDAVIAQADGIDYGEMPLPGGLLRCDLTWSLDGSRIAAAQYAQVAIHDRDLRLLGEKPIEVPTGVAFSPDGTLLAIGSWRQGTLVRMAEIV